MRIRMNFAKYLEKYKVEWLGILVFTCLCHSSMLLSSSGGIDTEALIADREGLYKGWMLTGRPGLVWLKSLLVVDSFNPYITGVGTIFFVVLSCILWTYLFYRITGQENKCGILAFSCIFSAHTILTEQMYFKLQVMELAVCFCLVAVAVYLSHQFALTKKWYYGVLSLPCSIIAFASYQAFNSLYLFGAIACFFLYYYFHCLKEEENITGKQLWFYILRFSVCFFGAFLINQLMTKLFFSGSGYLNGQVLWGQESVGACLFNIGKHMLKVLLGTQIYYAKTFGVYFLLLVLFCAGLLLHHKEKKGKYLGVIVLILLFLAPFLLTIICGGEPVVRSQLVLPFTLSFMAYALFLFEIKKERYQRILHWSGVVLGVLTTCILLQYTLLLNYTDEIRYQQDEETAFAIMADIDRVQDEEKSYPVVFIGGHPAALNSSCIHGETIGYSLLDWDTKVEPQGYFSTRRIVGFMNALGAGYTWADAETVQTVKAQCGDMTNWPMEGSIQLVDGVIVVKLGDLEE